MTCLPHGQEKLHLLSRAHVKNKPSTVVCASHPTAREAEVGRSPSLLASQPGCICKPQSWVPARGIVLKKTKEKQDGSWRDDEMTQKLRVLAAHAEV